jgi:hypothetical protein
LTSTLLRIYYSVYFHTFELSFRFRFEPAFGKIIKKNQKKELKEDFYKYKSINSVFNCVYCLIFALYPINSCNVYKNDYFCSAIFNTVFAQIYKIGFVNYLGESITCCSNISYILITSNRYMVIGRDPALLLKRISKIEIKRIIKLTILVSFPFNIGHIFEYCINYSGSLSYDNLLFNYGTDLTIIPCLWSLNHSPPLTQLFVLC